MKDIIPKILPIMVEAQNIISSNSNTISSSEKSGIGNIVTSTDISLETLIKSRLSELFPEAQIISEESAESEELNANANLKFIVDPLDGTTNYTNGWPHSIAIGIAENDDLTGGVIYDVLANKVYFGYKGKGVFECKIDDISNIEPVKQPEHIKENIKKSVISYDTPYGKDAFKTTIDMMSNLYHSGASLKIVGPISLDVLKTALGRENRPTDYNDAVWHTEVRAWDLAASTAILRELNGDIIGDDGKPLSVRTLTDPKAKIAFIASGNNKLLQKLYDIYPKISQDREDPTL